MTLCLFNWENVIYRTLRDAEAKHGSFWRDRVQQLWIQNRLSNRKYEENQLEELDEANGRIEDGEDEKEADPVKELVKELRKKVDKEKKEEKHKKNEDEEKKDSDQMNHMTRTLALLSVLITTMTFGATFSVPAAVNAHNNTTGHSNTSYFHGFMTANSTAFVCSLIATFCLMFSSMSIFKLQMRRFDFRLALFFTWSSLTSLTLAFGFGVRTVLAPVGLILSSIIFFLSYVVPFYQTSVFVIDLSLTYRLLSVRRGHKFVCWLFAQHILMVFLLPLWPFIIIILGSLQWG